MNYSQFLLSLQSIHLILTDKKNQNYVQKKKNQDTTFNAWRINCSEALCTQIKAKQKELPLSVLLIPQKISKEQNLMFYLLNCPLLY